MRNLLVVSVLVAGSLVVPAVLGTSGLVTSAYAATDACGNDTSGDSSGDSSSGRIAGSGIRAFDDAPVVDPGGDAYCTNLEGADDNGDVEIGDVLTAIVYVPAVTPATATISGYWCSVVVNDDGTTDTSKIAGTDVTLNAGTVYDQLTYTPKASDLQDNVGFCLEMSAPGYTTFSDNTPTAAVQNVWKVVSSKATISGTAKVGQVLGVATLPAMSPAADEDLTLIQWYRGKNAIDGANDATYTLVPADAGKMISFTVTLSRDGYADHDFTSNSVGPVKQSAKTDLFPSVPKVSGRAKVGSVLKVKTGIWKPGGVALTVQWYVGNKAVKGATKPTFKVTKAYANKRISVVVTGKKGRFTTSTAQSAPTKPVKK
jgi:hypothetical protein